MKSQPSLREGCFCRALIIRHTGLSSHRPQMLCSLKKPQDQVGDICSSSKNPQTGRGSVLTASAIPGETQSGLCYPQQTQFQRKTSLRNILTLRDSHLYSHKRYRAMFNTTKAFYLHGKIQGNTPRGRKLFLTKFKTHYIGKKRGAANRPLHRVEILK